MPSSGFQTCALDRKSTRLNSSHTIISYAVFCLKKERTQMPITVTSRATGTPRPRTDVPAPARRRSPPHSPLPPLPTSHRVLLFLFLFFNDTATTEIYTLSLHDALPILHLTAASDPLHTREGLEALHACVRSEEHTSELQSHDNLVCRLLLEKKKNT